MSQIEFGYALDFGSRRKRPAARPARTAGETAQLPIPRIARLLALAIRLEGLIREQKIQDYAIIGNGRSAALVSLEIAPYLEIGI